VSDELFSSSVEINLPEAWTDGKTAMRTRERLQDFADNWLSSFVSSNLSGDPLNRRTGNLAADWNTSAMIIGDEILVKVASTSLSDGGTGYAAAHEYGAEIVPVNARHLWIPTFENQTAKGVARISPTEAIEAGGFFTHNAFFARPLVNRGNRSDIELVPLFWLVDHVSIPATMGARESWVDAIWETIDEMIFEAEMGL